MMTLLLLAAAVNAIVNVGLLWFSMRRASPGFATAQGR